MRPIFAVAIVSLVVQGGLAAAWAAGPEVAAEGETRTEACAGAAASVAGNRNLVTFTGACKSLTLRGDGNRVSAGLGAGALIDVEGNGNQVRITAGKPGKLRVSGSNTSVVAAGGSPAPAASASLSGDAQTIELGCDTQPVTLESSGSRYVLRGGCRVLVIKGANNRVDAELLPAASVRIEGDGTIVTYRLKGTGAVPVSTILGVGSLLEADSQVAQLQAPPAPPAGITQVVSLMHDLGGVVILDGTMVRLPAGIFAGNDLGPNADGWMGRLGELIGQIGPTGLRIQGADPADPQVATGRANAVQAWLQQRAGVKLPVQANGAKGEGAMVDVTILR